MHFTAVAVCDPKGIAFIAAGAVTQNTAVIGHSVGRIARDILLIKANAHKVVVWQALEDQPLVNAVLDDGIVDAPAEKILGYSIVGSTFFGQKQDFRLFLWLRIGFYGEMAFSAHNRFDGL